MSELSNDVLKRLAVIENSNDCPVRFIRLMASELLKTCTWKYEDDAYFLTECGEMYSYKDADISHVKFCQNCRGKVIEYENNEQQ